jgi:hypothetical protein
MQILLWYVYVTILHVLSSISLSLYMQMMFIMLCSSVFEMSLSLVFFLYNAVTVGPRMLCCKSKRTVARPYASKHAGYSQLSADNAGPGPDRVVRRQGVGR